MRICYNKFVLHGSGEPYRLGTGEDSLPCPPRSRITVLHDSKHDVHRKYWSYFTQTNDMVVGCAPHIGAYLLVSVHSFRARPGLSVSAWKRESAPLFHVLERFQALTNALQWKE